MEPRPIPAEVTERERALLAEALRAQLQGVAPKRKTRMRKVSDHVKRTWVSAGCFGEAVQWKLAPPPKRKRKPGKPRGNKPADGDAKGEGGA